MFDIYELNSENETVENKASKLLENGFVRISSNSNVVDKDTLNVLRNEFEKSFQKEEYPRQLDLHLIKNKLIQDTIFQSLSNTSVKGFFKELSKQTGEEVTVFPFIDVMRNYFSGPQCGYDGWHNDAGGEYPYNYCLEKMNSGKYIFGKISISLQNNGKNGGNIDIAHATYKNNSEKSLRQRFSSKLSQIYFKFFRKSPSFPFGIGDQWFSDFSSLITSPKTLNPNPLDVIAFEHRLYHRGTPVSPSQWKAYLNEYPSLKMENYRIPKEFNFKEKNKYMIYAHFGNFIGLQSYVYDRSKRKNWIEERERWFNQYQKLKLFKKEYTNSEFLFRKVLEMQGLYC